MNLQYALLIIGLIIIAVVALTAYDMSRLRRPRTRPEPQMHESPEVDVPVRSSLLDATRDSDSDMVLRSDLDIALPEIPREEQFRTELRQLEEVATMPLKLSARLRNSDRWVAEPGRQYLSDDKIDFVIHLPGTQPVARDTALALFKQHEYKLNKNRHLYGQHHRTQHWSDLQLDRSSTRYDDLMLSLQLVDPNGPVDESELTLFSEMGLQLADALERPLKLSLTFEQGLERAAELQTFCDTYDVIAGIHVVPDEGQTFPGSAIEVTARQAGLVFGAMKIFHMNNDVAPGSPHLFSLANMHGSSGFDGAQWESIHSPGLTLFMSVPCVFQPGIVFDRMVATARAVATALGGHLHDQNRRPLTDKGIAVIHHQIEDIEEKMRTFGIPAGSDTALKLFNEAATL